jgi:hypothetical protein
MKLTRNNYEEYFILYMDNELDSDQRREVELFVQKNPDLKEELELLQQFKLSPDTSVVFRDKEELMSTAVAGTVSMQQIDLSNYEEWLVLYMDNELNPAQRKTVESFIASEPLVKNEWDLLQSTRLQPEEIVFPNRSSLYRTTKKVRPMLITLWRVAAAVLLILLAGSIAVIVFNDRKSSTGKDEEIVKTPAPADQKINTDKPVVTPEETNTPVHETVTAENKQKNILPVPRQAVNNPTVAVKEKKLKENDLLPVNAPVQVKKEEPVIVDNNIKPSNNLPQPANNSSIKNKPQPVDLTDNNNQKDKLSPNNALTYTDVTPTSPHSSDIVKASFENDTDDGAPSGKKNKLRGILRKVTRTFEKRTNIDATDDDNRLLVGGLAIKLK